MSTGTRIYVVSDKAGTTDKPQHRLIEAVNPSQALRHVAEGLFDVEVASQKALVRLAGEGIKVEEASAKPQTQQQPG
jgi:hypothetical protein